MMNTTPIKRDASTIKETKVMGMTGLLDHSLSVPLPLGGGWANLPSSQRSSLLTLELMAEERLHDGSVRLRGFTARVGLRDNRDLPLLHNEMYKIAIRLM